MGTWGTALYSDDLAADLRADFRDLIGEGLSADAACERLKHEYASVLRDPHEEPVFWLALADTAWRLGRLPEELRQNAVAVIDNGRDASRWELSKDKAKRAKVLARLRAQLLSTPPPPKRVSKPIRAANEWQVGEVVGFQLLSGRWVAMRVIGHHEDKGGRSAVCELLDWVGQSLPTTDESSTRQFEVGEIERTLTHSFCFKSRERNETTSELCKQGFGPRPLSRQGATPCWSGPMLIVS